jgi:hypothetical protein
MATIHKPILSDEYISVIASGLILKDLSKRASHVSAKTALPFLRSFSFPQARSVIFSNLRSLTLARISSTLFMLKEKLCCTISLISSQELSSVVPSMNVEGEQLKRFNYNENVIYTRRKSWDIQLGEKEACNSRQHQ